MTLKPVDPIGSIREKDLMVVKQIGRKCCVCELVTPHILFVEVSCCPSHVVVVPVTLCIECGNQIRGELRSQRLAGCSVSPRKRK